MTTYTLQKHEISHLRKLARGQADIAALPVMAVREKTWRDVNDGVAGARPPFAIESRTFDRDFLPDTLLQCRTELGRRLERTFLRHIRHHEILGDDHVCPDTLDMTWHVWHNEFGIRIKTERVPDSEGVATGYHFDHPITDLAKDGYDMVKPATFGVDREGTLAEKAFLEETFGDILPVAIRSPGIGGKCITQRLMRLMSMESFFMAMYDCPDTLHGLLGLLRDNAKRMAHWAEAEGLLVLNNGNQCTCGTCFNFTTQLPKRAVAPGDVKLKDLWAGMDSQETVGVSPELFHEFCFPYYADLAGMYGQVYWGCCEPADPIWESSLSKLPNLKAVSISRWADQAYMAEALSGKNMVYSRKPNPNLLGVDVELNEEAWAAEIRETLEHTVPKGVPTQLVVRDVYSLHGNLAKASRATEIARQEIDRFFAPAAE